MKSDYRPIDSNISFADASLLSFNYEEKTQFLDVLLECWNEEKVKITFENVLYFTFKPGDFISEIYQFSDAQIVIESLMREYNEIPENHSYKLISIKDINEFSIVEIVCVIMFL